MKIAFYNIYEELNINDSMFNNNNTSIGDNLLTPMIHLKKYAKTKKIEVATTDVFSIAESDAIVFIDMPNKNNKVLLESIKLEKKIYLLALESPLVRPESYSLKNHKLFEKVFTWSDDLVKEDGNKYIKINYSYEIPSSINKDLGYKKKLCCMIAGNKKVIYQNELYSKRKEAIRWFEKNHPDDFDLYGLGWDEASMGKNRYVNAILRRSKLLRRFFSVKYPSYKGKVERKKTILEQYKFSICFENIQGINGYITEKIFDSLFSGCIPIYLGARNIKEYIPENCFIDMNEYRSYEELYSHINGLKESEYLDYLNSIEIFLNSNKIIPFSIDKFAQTIIKEIKDDG